jgi:phage terminase large subunit
MRIEAVRRLGPKMRWHEENTEAGREAVGFYHEKKDEIRNIGLGPDHDWSSHSADVAEAFRRLETACIEKFCS